MNMEQEPFDDPLVRQAMCYAVNRDELNQVVIEQGRQIDRLIKQNLYLAELLKNETVKPQSEETPPPHY